MNRRQLLGAAAAGAALPACATTPSSAAPAAAAWTPGQGPWQGGRSPWPLCLDTATIRPASLEDKVRIAAEAGFDAIEPWEGELKEYERSGKSLADLRKRIEDAGLFVRGYISTCFGCPYEGPVPPARVGQVARRLIDLGCDEISLGDTIGAGTPRQAVAMLRKVADVIDTTGAGDSFNAGYLAARLDGAEPRQAAERGHELAGEVVRHYGALIR